MYSAYKLNKQGYNIVSYLELVCCSMSSSNYCFLTCIQVPQEAGQVVWYPHLFQNFPQFSVIHTDKGFGIVNKAEMDVFLELSCFVDDLAGVVLGFWFLYMFAHMVILYHLTFWFLPS